MKTQALPAGDPAKNWWTYADIAAHVGLAERSVRRRMIEWERTGFPRPLPYSKRELRWRTSAALAWFQRLETSSRAAPPQFGLVQGGRS